MPSALLRSDFDPMVGGFVIIMVALAVGLRLSRRPGPVRASGPVTAAGWGRLARHVAGTMLGGYLLLMAVVVLYYYLVARVGGAFIKSAFTGCALLIGLVTPVFAVASWIVVTRGRPGTRQPRTRTRPGTPGAGSGRS
jgi:Family of unknown function (DUF6256)